MPEYGSPDWRGDKRDDASGTPSVLSVMVFLVIIIALVVGGAVACTALSQGSNPGIVDYEDDDRFDDDDD